MSDFIPRFRDLQRKRLTETAKRIGVPPPNDYEVELNSFGNMAHGTKEKAEFCLNCFRMQWPNSVMQENLGVENYWLKRQIQILCRNRYVSFVGCASAGKTFISSAYAYTMWKYAPHKTSVYLSTTNAASGEARNWGAVKDLHASDAYKVGKRIEYRHMIVLESEAEDKERDYRDSIAAVLIKSGAEGDNAVSSICGRKNEVVIWICDEMTFMSPGILEARLNLNSNPFMQFIGIGNAPKEGDPLYNDATPTGIGFEDGWKTQGLIDRKTWPTRMGICGYFDGEKSPNLTVESGPAPFPRLCTREFMELTRRDAGGEETPGYWRQVRGFPHSADVQDTVLNKTLIVQHHANETAVWMGEKPKILAGLDLGFREGGDPCVVDFGKLGVEISGKLILQHEIDTVLLATSSKSNESFEDQIADRLLEECAKRDCHDVELDISSDGGIISQAIIKRARDRFYSLTVIPKSFSGKPDERQMFEVGGKRKPATEIFDRMVSQLWYSYRLAVQEGVIRGLNLHSKACSELCARKVDQDEKKRWSVETKKIMKKRIKRSPDNGDARVLLHDLARRHGLGSLAIENRTGPRQEPVRRSSGPAYQHKTQARPSYQAER